MSVEYSEYIKEHRANVVKAYEWLKHHFDDISDKMFVKDYRLLYGHDDSKLDDEEYDAYDKYFYGGNRSHEVVKNFKYAWLHHIHNNPHHWQYWVLQNDDEPEEVLEMPYEYVIEMICDWWSFSWKTGKLDSIFDWYEKHKDMKLHENTRKLVEEILDRIKKELEKGKEEENGTI
jgi:hypothetical protein